LPCHFSFAVRARDHRGLDGDLQAEGDRRRTRLRAGAKRRMAAERLSCLARNGRSPGEESLTGAVAAQAIEAQPSFGQIKPSEATWFARSDSTRRRSGGYRMTRTRGQARQAKEKKHLRTDGRHCMSGPRPHNAPHGGSCRIRWRRHAGPIEPLQRPRSGHALGDQRSLV
jgi:hypothetical protein